MTAGILHPQVPRLSTVAHAPPVRRKAALATTPAERQALVR
jgi:hypothetical protein